MSGRSRPDPRQPGQHGQPELYCHRPRDWTGPRYQVSDAHLSVRCGKIIACIFDWLVRATPPVVTNGNQATSHNSRGGCSRILPDSFSPKISLAVRVQPISSRRGSQRPAALRLRRHPDFPDRSAYLGPARVEDRISTAKRVETDPAEPAKYSRTRQVTTANGAGMIGSGKWLAHRSGFSLVRAVPISRLKFQNGR